MGQANLELRSPLDTKPTDERLHLWTKFLRLSPSYEVARQVACGLLHRGDGQAIVADIDRVLELYEDFGDVWAVEPQDFWDKKSFQLFGVRLAKPNLKVVHVMQAGQRIDNNALYEAVDTFATYTRQEMGNPLTALVSVPIDMKRADLMRIFGGMITHFKNNREDYLDDEIPEPKYKLSEEKRHLKVLTQALNAVVYRANNFNYPLWKIGADMAVNRHYADMLKKEGLISAQVFEAKNSLTATIGRILRQGLLVSENAARGIYPSFAENSAYAKKFDYKLINERLQQSA